MVIIHEKLIERRGDVAKQGLLKIAKPIIFSTEMVQAILDGRKTMTRRVVKFPEGTTGRLCRSGARDYLFYPSGIKNARYKVGDVLWVRETFCAIPYELEHIPIEGGHITTHKIAYKADSNVDYTGIWIPPIHMPKAVARIFLRVTANSRFERLHDITEKDAIAEGMTRILRSQLGYAAEESEETFNHYQDRNTFKILWDKLNKKRGYGWETNPWVEVIEFKRIGGL